MSQLSRVRGLPAIGRDVPKHLAPLLSALRESVQRLNTSAVLHQDFRDLLKDNINRVPLPSSGVGTEDISVITDPYFQDLKKQVDQALVDIAGMFAQNSMSEMLVRDNIRHIESVEQDLITQAGDMADQALMLAQQAQDLLDLATALEAIQTVVDDPVTGVLAQSTLLDATVSRVSANEDSIDVLTAQVTSLQSEIVDVSALDPGVMWQFESSDDGWTSDATLTPSDAFVSLDATSTQFTSPSGIAINGALFPRVVARVRRTAGTDWLGRLTYVTTGDGAHGFDPVNFHLTLAVEPNFAGGGWVIVTWNMELLTAGGNDWVTHTIDQIRIELADDGATAFDVDWIALARIAPSYVTSTVNALESRVTQAENDIDALSASVTTLTTSVDDLNGSVSANTSAISTLNTRITTAEGEIDVNSADILLLESRLDDAEADLYAQATAVSGLETSVSSIEGTLTSQASQLSSLDSRLDLLEPEVSGQATAISNLQADMTSAEGSLTAHAGELTSLDARLDLAEVDISANTGAISALDSRVDTAEGQISAHSMSLTSLDARLDDAESNISGQATAIGTLDARVAATESGIASTAAAVTVLQVNGRDSNQVNPLMTPGNSSGWDFFSSDVVPINIGGRSTVAARLRSAANSMRRSSFIEIDPRGIYEVRMSMLKTATHGYLYAGLYASTDGVSVDSSAFPVRNRAIVGGANNNPYWAYAGAQFADHTQFAANTWYDFVVYILGPEADPALCPPARLNNGTLQGSNFTWGADGYRLSPGARFAQLRVLNYYNAVLTDAYFNQFSVTRLDNQRTAALVEEASVRASADGTLSAERTIKIDVNGYVAGYGLAVVGGASGPVQSAFTVLADRFNYALPGVVGPTPLLTAGNFNGVPTVGINGNLIVDGTIVTRHLIAEAITTPTIKPGAVSNTVYTQSEADLGFSGGAFIPVLTLPVTVEGGVVRVDWYAELVHDSNINPFPCSINLYRDGIPIQSNHLHWTEVTNWLGRIFRPTVLTFFDVVTPGPHTYQIWAITPAGTGSWFTGLRGLAVTELKR